MGEAVPTPRLHDLVSASFLGVHGGIGHGKA